MVATEDLYVEGAVEGTIESPKNRVTVAAGGRVHASILASEVVILGEVKGNIEAGSKVDIQKGGSLAGDITTARIRIEDGAFVRGNVDSRKSLQGQFSPDGKWVAYTSNESGRYEVYVAPFPGEGGQRQVSPAGGLLPRWREDGKQIFYTGLDSQLMAAEIRVNGTELEIGVARQVPSASITGTAERGRAKKAAGSRR